GYSASLLDRSYHHDYIIWSSVRFGSIHIDDTITINLHQQRYQIDVSNNTPTGQFFESENIKKEKNLVSFVSIIYITTHPRIVPVPSNSRQAYQGGTQTTRPGSFCIR
ncbi:hypothetical protein TWF594_008184, partial [Orbilia oligospora]